VVSPIICFIFVFNLSQLRPPVENEEGQRFVLVRTNSGAEGYVQVRYVIRAPSPADPIVPFSTSADLACLNWPQSWFSKQNAGVTDNLILSKIAPAIFNLRESLLCVSLGRNSIGDSGATILSDTLSQCLFLKRLDLSENRIGSSGAIALSKIFRICRNISEVILSQNNFGDDGGTALAIAFKEASTPMLVLLHLSACQLSVATILETAVALKVHSGLIALDISRNNINSVGAEHIAYTLRSHSSLRNLDLSHNYIGDAGICKLVECLASFNSSVKRIGFESNDVTIEGGVNFLSQLHSRGIEYVSFGKLTLQSVVSSQEWQRTGLPTPPSELQDWVAGLAFISESLASGTQKLRRMRFMLIGNGFAGKTRLSGALLNQQQNSHPDVELSSRTIGIDCSPMQLLAPQGPIDVEIWDFAGQEVSYLSHTQYFSSRRCVYLLVWSPFMKTHAEGGAVADHSSFDLVENIVSPLLSWIEMLFLHVPDAQFILCGTHAALARQLNEANYNILCGIVQRRVEQKISDLAALAKAELVELKKREKVLEAQLTSIASSMLPLTNVSKKEDATSWIDVSKDLRLNRTLRASARIAAKSADLLRNVHSRISMLQNDNSVSLSQKMLQLLHCTRVDSSDGCGVPELRDFLIQHCECMPVLSEQIPKAWVAVESHFIGMHDRCGNVMTRDEAVSHLSSVMGDLKQPWEAIEFWAFLGRVFIYETTAGYSRQWWVVPNMKFLLDLIRPLIHWDPSRMIATDPNLCVPSARELYSEQHCEASALLVDLKQDSILRKPLLKYLQHWVTLKPDQLEAMLEFFHRCHLLCALDDNPIPSCILFHAQAENYLVTARVRDSRADRLVNDPASSNLNIHHALFCLPLLHISFLMRLQSCVIAHKTSLPLCSQLQNDCVFIRRNTLHPQKFYCCVRSMSVLDFERTQHVLSVETFAHLGFDHAIYVHSDDLGLFQFATQAIEETLATLFSGLRYKSCILAERNQISGLGRWIEIGVHSVPSFSEFCQWNVYEEFAPGRSLHSLCPRRRCPIFISHSWSDGTEAFVRCLRMELQAEALAAVCLDEKNFTQGGACDVQNCFRRGLCEAGVVIVCLTPRYLTRPNCLKELQWALDLSAHKPKRISAVFLPLHPALTYRGIESILKHRVVYCSAKSDAACYVFPLSELALTLLERLQLEHIAEQDSFKYRWSEMKLWDSDNTDGDWDESVLGSAVRQLVSQPAVSDFLASEFCVDENEALCKDLKMDKRSEGSAIFQKNIVDAHRDCYSPELYPEKTALPFFWSFVEELRGRKMGSFFGRWIQFQCSCDPQLDPTVSFRVNCDLRNVGDANCWAEMMLLQSDSLPCESPDSSCEICLDVILIPENSQHSGIRIDRLQVSDGANRKRWIGALKKLPVLKAHVDVPTISTAIAPSIVHAAQTILQSSQCDLFISLCKKAQFSAGRNMALYISSIMDSLHRVQPSTKVSFCFGNCMDDENALLEVSRASTCVFLLTSEISIDNMTDYGDAFSCECFCCTRVVSARADETKFRANKTQSSRFRTYCVKMERYSKTAAHPFLDKTILSSSFGGNIQNQCVFQESYLEGSILDEQVLNLLKLSDVPEGFLVKFRSKGRISIAHEEMETRIRTYFEQTLLLVNEGDEFSLSVNGLDVKIQISDTDPPGCCLVTSETRIIYTASSERCSLVVLNNDEVIKLLMNISQCPLW